MHLHSVSPVPISPPSAGPQQAAGSGRPEHHASAPHSTESTTHSAAERRNEAVRQQEFDSQVRELRRVDREVRLHERQHAAAAGPHGGAPSYTYQRGPDGVLYAVGGHVDVDLSPVPGDPEATLAKALQIRRAAMAPAEPSAADRGVAMQAAQMAMQARADIAKEQTGIYAAIAVGDTAHSASHVDEQV